MENLIWILPLLACPLGMFLMGAIGWFAAKLGRRPSKPREESTAKTDQDSPSTAAPEAA